MKRALKFVPMLALCLAMLFCSGCGDGADQDRTEELRSALLGAENLSFVADLRCDYGDRVWDCSLAFSGGLDAAAITVLQPDVISGLEIVLEDGGSSLRYADAVLDTGALLRDGSSAVEALPLILKSWESAYVTESYSEKLEDVPTTVLALEAGTEQQVLIWFSDANVPLQAEVQENGETRIFCNFKDFTYNN